MYDLALARAVAEMRVLAELSLPFVKQGGYFVGAKGPNPQVCKHPPPISSDVAIEIPKNLKATSQKRQIGYRYIVAISETKLSC